MGRDKALVTVDGVPLAARVARAVREAAGSVVLVGDPVRHAGLGIEVVPDRLPGCGPLGGIHAALAHTACEWNLIVACDMPRLPAELLRDLLDAAERHGSEVLLPSNPEGRMEPLCGVWRRSAYGAVEAALGRGIRKVAEAVRNLNPILYPAPEMLHFSNINTPEDLAAHAPR
jgi:molybdopterin-guanine dinucleotide biosynthesis protein A